MHATVRDLERFIKKSHRFTQKSLYPGNFRGLLMDPTSGLSLRGSYIIGIGIGCQLVRYTRVPNFEVTGYGHREIVGVTTGERVLYLSLTRSSATA